MIKNYLKTALRNLARRKVNSIINIAGLSVGFAAFLLIFLVVQYEQSFDTFHIKKDKLYRVVRISKNPVNREYRTGVPVPVMATLRTDFPQLANVGSMASGYSVQVIVPAADGSTAKKFKENTGIFFAEPQFFRMFDFGLAAGNIKDALNAPNTMLLTKIIAVKYFGDWKTAIGKTLKLDGINMKVSGILNDIPVNTDFPIKGVVSFATLKPFMDFNDWGSINDGTYCFVQLADNDTKAQFDRLLSKFVDKHIKPINPGYDLVLQPLSEMHYDGRFPVFSGHTFSKDLIFALNAIGIFLLVIACVNFINLTTAQAVNRAREVGVRKVLGGNRMQLIIQFFGETGITCLLVLVVAACIVFLFITPLNNLLNIHVPVTVLYKGEMLLFMLMAWVAITIFAGFYPAMVLSGFKSVTVLKGSPGTGRQKGISFRRGLVVFQFVIAQTLIIATLVVASQMDYFRTADMGFTKEAIITSNFPNDSVSVQKSASLRNDLLKLAGVENVSFSLATPVGVGWFNDLRTLENHGKQPDMVVGMSVDDAHFFDLYHLKLVAGRAYLPSDTPREYVVNETVVKNLGLRNPQEAIGKMINVSGKTFPIIGVVKNFHISSFRDEVRPVVMTTIKNAYQTANIKINLAKAKPVIAGMEASWNLYFPDYTFEYSFLDQTIADFYQQENQLSKLYKIFSGIAIFISCLGLYGLISFMAVQRKKEIGIRKVLGAPVINIVIMLSKEFTMLIAIAFLIATPVAWYFMHLWLQQYAYRIMIGIWFFAATIAGSLIIAWLTVGYTAIKAALANPVKSLRTE